MDLKEEFWKLSKEAYLDLTPRQKKKFLKKMFPDIKKRKEDN